jgi:hypothetical protein
LARLQYCSSWTYALASSQGQNRCSLVQLFRHQETRIILLCTSVPERHSDFYFFYRIGVTQLVTSTRGHA